MVTKSFRLFDSLQVDFLTIVILSFSLKNVVRTFKFKIFSNINYHTARCRMWHVNRIKVQPQVN